MIIMLGKELEKGYSQDIRSFNLEENILALKEIQTKIPEKLTLYSISPTNLSQLQEVDNDYLPKILEFSKYLSVFLNPFKIFQDNLFGKGNLMPNADFIIFDEKDEIAVIAYSNSNPIIVFECIKTGKKAIGVIKRKALKNHGMYIIDNIVKHMGGKVKLTIALCTYYEYPDMGTIPDLIKEICSENEDIIDIELGINTDKNPNFYEKKDIQNNVVILI